MAQIPPIEDAYIDQVIKAQQAYNPNINKTQGAPMRELIKLLRDRLEQQIAEAGAGGPASGLPPGGAVGNVLAKSSNDDYQVVWRNLDDKADLIDGKIPYVQLPAIFSPPIDITYAELTGAMAVGNLETGALYRITDYRTVHNIPNVSPVTINTGPVEALVVLAVSPGKIGTQAWSADFPQDIIIYTTDNSRIPGAQYGCILRRIDTLLDNDICNDFRHVKYRRWKFNPPVFDANNAYPIYSPVLYTDGAVYFVTKPGGFAAGTATTPSANSNDWAQVAPNNNYYMSRSGAASSALVYTSNNSSQPVRNVSCPVKQSDFIDSVVFPNYGPAFFGNTIDNGPGNLFDMVIFNAGQATVMRFCKFGCFLQTTLYQSTFVVIQGYLQAVEFRNGLAFVLCILNGNYIYDLIADRQCYASTFNVSQIYRVKGQFYYSFVRGRFCNADVGRSEFMIYPNLVRQLYAPFGIGNIKFMSNAEIRGLTLLTEFGNEYLAGDINQGATAAEQYVDVPLLWKTAIGSFANAYNVSGNLADMLAKLKTRHIAYAYEQPASKSVITITNGQNVVKAWQTDPADINLTDMSGNDGIGNVPVTFRYMSFFTRHGNDFQVLQKDLTNGAWVPNHQPAYSIDALDGNGNVTQVTFRPNTAAAETRFIII